MARLSAKAMFMRKQCHSALKELASEIIRLRFRSLLFYEDNPHMLAGTSWLRVGIGLSLHETIPDWWDMWVFASTSLRSNAPPSERMAPPSNFPMTARLPNA